MGKLLAEVNIGDQFWLKPGSGIKQNPAYQSLGAFISAILPNVYLAAGIIVFFLIIISGLMFIKNAGKGDPESSKKWQQTLTLSITGLLIIFLSYWIIQIIEAITGVKIF